MNNTYYLSLSGLGMILAGIAMFFSEQLGIGMAKIAVPLGFFLGGICAFFFSRANAHHKIAKQFHMLQGIGMILFALVISTLAKDLEGFLKLTTYFLMVYGLFEIMFSFSVLRTKFKMDKSILITRLLVGAINIIGAVALLLTMIRDARQGLTVASVLILLGGIGFFLFSLRISKKAMP